MRQTACLVFNPIMVEGYAALFSCTAVRSFKELVEGLPLPLGALDRLHYFIVAFPWPSI